jgi:hypothetical protein
VIWTEWKLEVRVLKKNVIGTTSAGRNATSWEELAEKVLKAYARTTVKAEKRNLKRKTGKSQWHLMLNVLVSVKSQLIPDAVQGVTEKFQRPYEGPYIIQKIINSYPYSK